MPIIQLKPQRNTTQRSILPRKRHAHTIKIRHVNTKQEPRKCIQATIVVVPKKLKHTCKKQKKMLIPVDMNDPVLDGLPVMFHDKETGTPSFTKGDMAVPTIEPIQNKTKKTRKKKRKRKKKITPLHEYLKSFSIST
jgi:hypothetical protein